VENFANHDSSYDSACSQPLVLSILYREGRHRPDLDFGRCIHLFRRQHVSLGYGTVEWKSFLGVKNKKLEHVVEGIKAEVTHLTGNL